MSEENETVVRRAFDEVAMGDIDSRAQGSPGGIKNIPLPLLRGELEKKDAGAEDTNLSLVREATGPGGLDETITAWSVTLPIVDLAGDRSIPLSGTLSGQALPSIELPHGRASATFHVILAIAWAPDLHLVRDVAVATTLEL